MSKLAQPAPAGGGFPPRTLLLLAVAAVVATIVFAWGTPLTSGRMSNATAPLISRLPFWSFLAEHRPGIVEDPSAFAVLLLGACVVAFAACALAIRLSWNRGSTRAAITLIMVTALLCVTVTWLAPPNLNSNLWNYMLRGRIAAAYGENPYTTAADEFPQDPLSRYANPANTHSPGGKLAVWMMCDIAFARLGAGDPVRTLYVYRTALLLIAIGNLWLVFALARRLVPQHAAAATILWGWNPLVIMNSLARADPLMILFLLLGVLALVRARRSLAAVPLGLSVYVKLVTAPLLAVIGLAELRAHRWRTFLTAALLLLLTTFVVWLPFIQGNAREIFASYVQATEEAPGAVSGGLKRVLMAGFAILVLAVGLTRREDVVHRLHGCVLVQIYFSLFFAKFASADYLMPLVALVALTMDWRAVLLTLALGASYFLFDEWYLVRDPLFPMPDLFPFSRTVVFLLPPIGAAVLVLIFLGRRRLRQAATP